MKTNLMHPLRKKVRSERGQTVILIAVVLTSFVMFFGFAINTGILVAAKISVQAAADAAAYAGAATQARQLNAISFLNYDMRRQYKKLLYRYNFFGNITSSGSFPNPNHNSPSYYLYPRKAYPDVNDTTPPVNHNLKVPIVCIALTGTAKLNTNCQSLNTRNMSALATSNYSSLFGANAISQTALAGIQSIADTTKQACQTNGIINLFTTLNWLFRGSPDPSKTTLFLAQIDPNMNMAGKARDQVENSTRGLGLYPRNIIHLMRIETLEGFLNEPAKSELDLDRITSLEQAQNAEVHERTIQAFKSALVNLNNEVIRHDSVIMDELQNDRQISLTPIKPSFNIYVQILLPNGSTSAYLDCNSQVISFVAKKAPVGVRRQSGPPVHYAVKIKTKAKLLFMPSGTSELELNAVAAAKPFGSRIGPDLTEEDFVDNIQPAPHPSSGATINDCTDNDVKCNIPNLTIKGAISTLHFDFLNAQKALAIDANKNYNYKGLAEAMAPTPEEIGKYNIIPPPPADPSQMNYEFIPFAKNPTSSVIRFYAPIFPSSGGNIDDRVEDFVDEIFGTTVSANNPFQVNFSSLIPTIKSEIKNYIKTDVENVSSLSEYGESMTFAALQLPMGPPKDPDNNPLSASPNKLWLTKSEEVLSSWGPKYSRVSSSEFALKPRFGYSVKFVAMQKLLQEGMNEKDSDQPEVSH